MQYKIDETARSIAAAGTSRRGALKTIFAGALGAVGLITLNDVEAKGRKAKGRKGKGKGRKGQAVAAQTVWICQNNESKQVLKSEVSDYLVEGGDNYVADSYEGKCEGTCYGACYEYDPNCGDGCTCVYPNKNSYEGSCEAICDPSYCDCGCDDYTNQCIPQHDCPVYCSGTCSEYYPDCDGYGCACDLEYGSYTYGQCIEAQTSRR